jgi:hypothetical protein
LTETDIKDANFEETIHLFLDNSGSMFEEDRLEKGKNILDGIRERLFGSHVYAYLIGNKTYSHMYFSPKDHVILDIDNYEQLIKSSWNA